MERDVQNKVILKEGYYLDNFLKMIYYVKSTYVDILTEPEISFVDDFDSMSLGAQRLYVRLITRRGPFFRLDKLKYTEIPDIEGVVYELSKSRFLVIYPPLPPVRSFDLTMKVSNKLSDQKRPGICEGKITPDNLAFALKTLTKPEIIDFLNHNPQLGFNIKSIKNLPKDEIIQELLIEENSIWDRLIQNFSFLYPLRQEIVALYHLMFFGNLRQELHEFILEDIGVLKYEPYVIRKEDRFFNSREVIDGYIFLADIKAQLYEAFEIDDQQTVIYLGDELRSYDCPEKLNRKFSHTYSIIGRFYEKQRLYDQALDYYDLSFLPPARERKARILEAVNCDNDALMIVSSIIEQPYDYYELEFARSFSEKLKKKLGFEYQKQKKEQFNYQDFILENEGVRVEEIALKAYINKGFTGFYSENYIWKALFGLAFWDIIFMPVPEVFFNPFQRGPADLFSTDFKVKRKDAIKMRINEILNDEKWKDKIINTYNRKFKTANFFVNWKEVQPEQIERIIDWIPRDNIAEIFSRMSDDLRDFKTGFPDLLLFDNEPGNYLLVEVKGPGDQLRDNQKRWLRFFGEKNIPFEVARIKWKNHD